VLQELDPHEDRLDYWLRQRQTLRYALTNSVILENWNEGESGSA